MQLYHTENNLSSYGTELVLSDVALFNFWTAHKCDVCMCRDRQHLTGRKYTHASVVEIYACSFSGAFWMGFGSGLKCLVGGAHMWGRCLNSHCRLWRQGAQFGCPHSAAWCHLPVSNFQMNTACFLTFISIYAKKIFPYPFKKICLLLNIINLCTTCI